VASSHLRSWTMSSFDSSIFYSGVGSNLLSDGAFLWLW